MNPSKTPHKGLSRGSLAILALITGEMNILIAIQRGKSGTVSTYKLESWYTRLAKIINTEI